MSRNQEQYTVGWLCALPVELAASRMMLDESHEHVTRDTCDDNIYTLGRIGPHNVVIACLPEGRMGTTSATTAAVRMRATFPSIQFGLMVGIGGGVPSENADIRLGDVVIGKPGNKHGGVIQYDFGKDTPSGFDRTGGFLNAPPTILLNAVSSLRARGLEQRSTICSHLSCFDQLPEFHKENAGPDVLFPPEYEHERGPTCDGCIKEKDVRRPPRSTRDIVIHYGTIASGNRVIRDSLTRDRLSRALGGILCFEMETAGLMNDFPCLAIRGICDYADSHKNKAWQKYASAAAAACAKEILIIIPPTTTSSIDSSVVMNHLRSAIAEITVNEFLALLPSPEMGVGLHAEPRDTNGTNGTQYAWIFRNIDYKEWTSANTPQTLWISGPPASGIHQASRRISLNMATSQGRQLLYFSSASITGSNGNTRSFFVYSILRQLIRDTQAVYAKGAVDRYLLYLADIASASKTFPQNQGSFSTTDHHQIVKKLLRAFPKEHLGALASVLITPDEQQRETLIVVDGIDADQNAEHELLKFVQKIQQGASRSKILITSQPWRGDTTILGGFSYIEHNVERNACLASLRFCNTRYAKITEEHEGSCNWIWRHTEYQAWSKSPGSKLLYLQGKPGSGKSTLTKYFYQQFRERYPAPTSAVFTKFFYSYREGESQRSHYSMLQTILYDLLSQEETFFYHTCQSEYREQLSRGSRNWEYRSLKKVLQSLRNYDIPKDIYLIIDAIDESDGADRRNILDLLFDLCSKTECCTIKAFVACRPVGQLDLRRGSQNFIRMQDETEADIARFAQSFLHGLQTRDVSEKATQYIVTNAQGVFLWVKLVGKELALVCEEEGYSEAEIFDFLQQLPTELENFYEHMLHNMTRKERDLSMQSKLFHVVLFGIRPLTVDEMLHVLAIPDNTDQDFKLSYDAFQKCIPSERRILSLGGNFIEIKRRAVQVIHQTVREFFLGSKALHTARSFILSATHAHSRIFTICMRYILLGVAEARKPGGPPWRKKWTPKHLHKFLKHVNTMPLKNYALEYLCDHFQKCQGIRVFQEIVQRLAKELSLEPDADVMEAWMKDYSNRDIFTYEQGSALASARDNVLITALSNGIFTSRDVVFVIGTLQHLKWTPNTAMQVSIDMASWIGNEGIFKSLLCQSGGINAANRNQQTPLHLASLKGYEEVVRVLLRRGADYESTDELGLTPLMWAAYRGHDTVVEILVQNGANVNSEGFRNWFKKGVCTPLLTACIHGHERIVDILVQAGADLQQRAPGGRTPLHLACVAGSYKAARSLIQGRAAIDAKDDAGRTPVELVDVMGYRDLKREVMAGKMLQEEDQCEDAKLRAVQGKVVDPVNSPSRGLVETSLPLDDDSNTEGVSTIWEMNAASGNKWSTSSRAPRETYGAPVLGLWSTHCPLYKYRPDVLRDCHPSIDPAGLSTASTAMDEAETPTFSTGEKRPRLALGDDPEESAYHVRRKRGSAPKLSESPRDIAIRGTSPWPGRSE